MARGVIQKYTVKMKLNNGTSPSGATKTVSISIGSTSNAITTTNYAGTDGSLLDAGRAKALAISTAVGACLTKPVYELEEVAYASIVS